MVLIVLLMAAGAYLMLRPIPEPEQQLTEIGLNAAQFEDAGEQ